ncbi:MAG: hypothetical protein PHH87_10825 [Desulfuromonas sp.]|nr:hypothetical protein [Desulfuromonas sp.]
MLVVGDNRFSQLKTCLEAAPHFLLSENEAVDIFDRTETVIRENWDVVCEEAELSTVDKALMWKRQFLNPFSTER